MCLLKDYFVFFVAKKKNERNAIGLINKMYAGHLLILLPVTKHCGYFEAPSSPIFHLHKKICLDFHYFFDFFLSLCFFFLQHLSLSTHEHVCWMLCLFLHHCFAHMVFFVTLIYIFICTEYINCEIVKSVGQCMHCTHWHIEYTHQRCFYTE